MIRDSCSPLQGFVQSWTGARVPPRLRSLSIHEGSASRNKLIESHQSRLVRACRALRRKAPRAWAHDGAHADIPVGAHEFRRMPTDQRHVRHSAWRRIRVPREHSPLVQPAIERRRKAPDSERVRRSNRLDQGAHQALACDHLSDQTFPNVRKLGVQRDLRGSSPTRTGRQRTFPRLRLAPIGFNQPGKHSGRFCGP